MALTFLDPNQRPTAAIAGQMRVNTQINMAEVFDGVNWIPVADYGTVEETMSHCVQVLEDQIAIRIEEEYKDNATIQDAFREWEAANERFRVILELAEKK